MTNLGTFRAFAVAYLKSHPDIQPNMTCMVRQIETSGQGVPLEIYCFTGTTVWAEYERIQGAPKRRARGATQPGGSHAWARGDPATVAAAARLRWPV